jgi:hypothetical protein
MLQYKGKFEAESEVVGDHACPTRPKTRQSLSMGREVRGPAHGAAYFSTVMSGS